MIQRPHRVQKLARAALIKFGGKLTTADLAQMAYPYEPSYSKGQYQNVKRALRDVGAVPTGRSKQLPGRPLLWQLEGLQDG